MKLVGSQYIYRYDNHATDKSPMKAISRKQLSLSVEFLQQVLISPAIKAYDREHG